MNTSFSPFNILTNPLSGSLSVGTEINLIRFKRLSTGFPSGSQMDLGSLGLKYTTVDSGSSADLIFKISSPESYAYTSSEVFRISATGSTNEARIGIGKFDSDDINFPLHVKGDTMVDGGEFKLKGGSETISLTKDNLKDILRGRAISDTAKNAERGGLTSTITANALVNLADTNTLIKNSETGKIEIQANNTTLLVADNAVKPSLSLGATGGAKVNITGSTEISGSTTVSGSFTVTDLLTVLADYGQTGSFSVSGSTTLDGDLDANGIVNFQDLITVVNGFNVTNNASSSISGSLTISSSAGIPALSITGSTGLSGSLVITGSSTLSGSIDLEGVTTTYDLLNAIAGFQASGSNVVTGSLVMATTSSQGLGTYFDVEGDAQGATLKISIGDADNVGNGTAVVIDDANENVTITGSLDITGNQVDFTNLPTSDPGVTGRLYKRTGTQLGFTGAASASSFVLISA
jgi:hypothetical protein